VKLLDVNVRDMESSVAVFFFSSNSKGFFSLCQLYFTSTVWLIGILPNIQPSNLVSHISAPKDVPVQTYGQLKKGTVGCIVTTKQGFKKGNISFIQCHY